MRFASLVVLLPLSAFAQDVLLSPPNFVAGAPWWAGLLMAVFGLLSTVVTAVLLPAARNWLVEKAKTSAIANIGLKVEHFAATVVAELDATMKPALAKALADGVINEVEKQELRDLALGKMKNLLGTAGLAEVTGVLGIGVGAVESYLMGVLEKQVDVKNNAAAVAVVPLTP